MELHDAFAPGARANAQALAGFLGRHNHSWRAAAGAAARYGGVPTPLGDTALAHIVDLDGPAHLHHVHGGTAAVGGGAPPGHLITWALHRVPMTVLGATGPLWAGELDVTFTTTPLANNAVCTGSPCGNGDGPSASGSTRRSCSRAFISGYVPFYDCGDAQKGCAGLFGAGAPAADAASARGSLRPALQGSASDPITLAVRSPTTWAGSHPTHAAWIDYFNRHVPAMWTRTVLRAPLPGEHEGMAIARPLPPPGPTDADGPTTAAVEAAAADLGSGPLSCADKDQGSAGWAAQLNVAGPDAPTTRMNPCGYTTPMLCDRPCAWISNTDGDVVTTGYLYDTPVGGLCCPSPPSEARTCGSSGARQALHPAFPTSQRSGSGPDKDITIVPASVCMGPGVAGTPTTPYMNAAGQDPGIRCWASSQSLMRCGDILGPTGLRTDGSRDPGKPGLAELAPINDAQADAFASNPQLVAWCTKGTATATRIQGGRPGRYITAQRWVSDDAMFPFLDVRNGWITAAFNNAMAAVLKAPIIVPSPSKMAMSDDVPALHPPTGPRAKSARFILCPGDPDALRIDAAFISGITGAKGASSTAPASQREWLMPTTCPTCPDPIATATVAFNGTLTLQCTVRVGILLTGLTDSRGNPYVELATGPFLNVHFVADVAFTGATCTVSMRTVPAGGDRNIQVSNMRFPEPSGSAAAGLETATSWSSFVYTENPFKRVGVTESCTDPGTAATLCDAFWSPSYGKNSANVTCIPAAAQAIAAAYHAHFASDWIQGGSAGAAVSALGALPMSLAGGVTLWMSIMYAANNIVKEVQAAHGSQYVTMDGYGY